MNKQIAVLVRTILVVAWAASTAQAQDETSELNQMYGDIGADVDAKEPRAWRGFLGAGAFAVQRADDDNRVFVLPLVSVSYKDTFYWQVARGGVWLLKSEDRLTRAGVAIKPRRGFDPDNYEGLTGMEQRDTSVELGVNALWVTRPLVISAGYFTDVSGKSEGDSAVLSLAHRIRVSDRLSITPSLGAEWLSADVVGYYYGVTANEATAARPAFEGKASVNWRAGLMAHYRLAREWSLFGGAGYTWFGSGITDSPIIIREGVAALHFGGGWHF